MIQYDQYYYRHGVRKYEFLTNPPLTPLTAFELPFHPIFHYLPQSATEIGPKYDEIWFQSVGGQRFVDHVLEMTGRHGTPIWAKKTPQPFVDRFRKKETQFRRMTDLEQIAGARTNLTIVNYAILQHLWNYRDTYLTPYYRWRNIKETLWSEVARIAKIVPEQNQFVVIDIVDPIPPLAKFKLAAEKHTRASLAVFNTPDLLDLLDLFNWAGVHRDKTTLAVLDEVTLTKTNLIFNVGGFWSLLNLGTLNQWIKGEGVGDQKEIDKGKDGTLMQKQLLAFFNRLYTVKSTADSKVETKEYQPEIPTLTDAKEPEEVKAARSTVDVNIDDYGSLGFSVPTPPVIDFDFGTLEEESDLATDIQPKPVIKVADLETGERIVSTFWDLDKPPIDIDDIIQPVTSELTAGHGDEIGQYDLGVLSTAAEYHRDGLITNAEFSRFERLSGKFRELQFDDNRTVAEACVIKESDLKDVKSFKLPDIPTVIDKSMLESTLTVFDRNYVEKILQSDIANMLMAPQRAGFALTAFSKERTETCMDKSDLITVAYTPVDGERTVLKFPIPVIEPDGRYMMNGVRYFLKKQRIDMPIRKVAPNKVALTSYYGKTFIWRSERVTNDYGAWLLREAAVGMKKKDTQFSDIHFGQGVTNVDRAPRVMTTFASTYRSFNYGPYAFWFVFDQRDRFPKECYDKPKERFPIAELTEGNKRIPILVDRQGECWRWDNQESVGTIETILGFNSRNAPMDVAELALFSKRIPMALVLAYHYGIEELFNRLDAQPTFHDAAARPKLTDDEYSIRFRDCVVVLNKRNRLASMILSGFNDIGPAVSNYDYLDFNGHDAIMNVLDSKGLSGRYLGEVDNQFLLFLDHITRGLLKDMGEPTEFGPLLIRACQLLLVDDCPDETDMNFMRLAGYERVAGAVYREVSRALRTQRGKRKGRRGKIELRPDAILRRIQADGSSQIVEDSTPIHNLKEQEAVTTGGDGGRSARSMVRRTRSFNKNDLGTISEATVDSSSVAINTSMVSNPKFTSLRGTTARYKDGDGAASLLSTSALLAAGSDRDDQFEI